MVMNENDGKCLKNHYLFCPSYVDDDTSEYEPSPIKKRRVSDGKHIYTFSV